MKPTITVPYSLAGRPIRYPSAAGPGRHIRIRPCQTSGSLPHLDLPHSSEGSQPASSTRTAIDSPGDRKRGWIRGDHRFRRPAPHLSGPRGISATKAAVEDILDDIRGVLMKTDIKRLSKTERDRLKEVVRVMVRKLEESPTVEWTGLCYDQFIDTTIRFTVACICSGCRWL